ncbi:hypothetical protein SAMN05421821_11479 [Mucilaginibacter lappiensis]|uniref:Collagen-like protein n=1 Tax=Mucilaginibacter lappiensis TaxID=354630 RepID=A0ABR6PPU7_9SPHI|nr:hypothetical protein [Mucilaginibacter lappiensis]MBB6111798.1 hypothetical protein [Mucilaginibacter lappiensis]SIR87733.1 hypothetical protein SAMN05421821_11479 [Mucilaginibacter lappiensis]
MKKRTLSFITVLFSLCLLIFACRKEINNLVVNDHPNVSADLLESAKIWNEKIVAQSAAINQKTENFVTLKPQWKDSWTIDSKPGTKFIAVPTIEDHVSNRSINIRRLYVFEANNNQITDGKIIEFVGFNYPVDHELDNLIKNFHSNTIVGFNGAIIQCDLNFRWTEGAVYENGNIKQNDITIAKSTHSKDIYLSKYSLDANGIAVYQEITYLYTPDGRLRVQDASGSGLASGSGFGGTLSEVVISGTPTGGNPGGGGGFPPNPPTNPPPSGGGSGGGTGGPSAPDPAPNPTPSTEDTDGNGKPVSTDCSSFAFTKTSTANWQEAGVRNIRLKWVWIGGGSAVRELYVPSVVFGLPTQYQNSNGSITTLSASQAAVVAAKITESVKLLTYMEFRNSPYSPSDATVISYFKTQLQIGMATQRGTAGATGSGSNQIIFKDEQRSSFFPFSCN